MIDLKDKEICVLGLGASGFAVCKLLLAKGINVKVSEINDNPNTKNKLKILHDKGVRLEIGT